METRHREDLSRLSGRLQQLQKRFAALEARIEESPVKEALSLLHGMLHEVWRGGPATAGADGASGLDTIANLWRSAPPMEGAAENEPFPVGSVAPDFELPDASGTTFRLSEMRGRPVVLVFYPLDWSPGCSQQLDLYQSEMAGFRERGAVLVAISVDSIYSHGAWAAVRGLGFPLLSDFHPHGEVARRYRVYRESDGFSERALYVVDPEGVIRYAQVSAYLHHVPDVEELFRALDALRKPEAAAAGGAS